MDKSMVSHFLAHSVEVTRSLN